MLDKAYGCLIGAAIGDAMGMPASFLTANEIKESYGKITDFVKPGILQVAHGGLRQAEITDDTEESIIISKVLIDAKGFDTELFIKYMRRWAIKNNMLNSTVIGPSTRKFLETIINGEDYLESGKLGDTNGGAMRAAPLGIFYNKSVDEAIEYAIKSAKPSHGSKPGMSGTCAIAAATSKAVAGNCTIKQVMEAALYGAYVGEENGFDIPTPSLAKRILLSIDIVESNRSLSLENVCSLLYQYIGGSMKSYESIPFSLGVFYAANGNFQQGMISAINQGDDADTNGAIVGSLCGAFEGSSNIRIEWIEKVTHENKINFLDLAKQLIKLRE